MKILIIRLTFKETAKALGRISKGTNQEKEFKNTYKGLYKTHKEIMGFKDKLKNDETFENGIARFEIETDYPSDIIWRKGDFL